MAGFIYVMSNPAMPGIYKVGKSIKDPAKDRLSELSSSTSVPEPFKLEYYCFIDKFDAFEVRLHKELSHLRPNPTREFFKVELRYILEKISELAPMYGGIKFQEPSYVPINEPEYIPPSDDAKNLEINPASDHQGADIILKYNNVAKENYELLEKFPGDGHLAFKQSLTQLKNLDEISIRDLFRTQYKKKFIEPFDELLSNFYYRIIADKSKDSAKEFYDAHKALKGSVTARQLTIDICEKFKLGVNVKSFPLLELQILAKDVRQNWANDPLKLNPYLSEFDLKLEEGRYFYTLNYYDEDDKTTYVVKEVDRSNLHSLYQFFENEFDPEKYSDNFLEYESKRFFMREHFKSVRGFQKPSGTSIAPSVAIKDSKHGKETIDLAEGLANLSREKESAQTGTPTKYHKTLVVLVVCFFLVLFWSYA